MENTATAKFRPQYTAKNLGDMIIDWNRNNNFANLNRGYSADALSFVNKLDTYISDPEKIFDEERIKEIIGNMKYEAKVGYDIIDNLVAVIEKETEEKIRKGLEKEKLKIHKSIQILETNSKKFESFLEKTKLILESKEIANKYEKEIAEILNILKPR